MSCYHARLSLLALLLNLCVAGCALDSTARRLGAAGTEGAVAGLGQDREAVRKLLRDLLLQDDSLQRMAQNLTQGVLGEMSQPQQEARVQALVAAMAQAVEQYGDPVVQKLLRTGSAEIESTLQRIARDTLQRADEAVKQLVQKDIMDASQVLLKRYAEILASSLADQLQGHLGKSLEQASGQIARAMVQEAAQGLRSPDTQAALREILRGAMREGVVGVGQGLREELHTPTPALVAGLTALGTLLLLSALGLVYILREYRMSSRALAIIAQKINETPGDPKLLKRAIAEGAQRNRVEPWLSDFLKKRGL